ncbi:ferritin-like domain-containing protein [Ancylobacter pratisalsi]|uniref:Ferritin-like domain-containing protein n=1 Tax=Ancylobacter pratisalsi TaxID=1745854 RepID=A0A6P1YK98_9HYPH|nr:DUF892 family protein [Ancylobacter pratisalsi]QIB33758.1 ferritin-like domain-containing protein [Ancylobacter pratisalsi]
MGLLTKDIKSLDDLLRQGLGELHYSERRVARAAPALRGKASDALLRRELDGCLQASSENIARLVEAFRCIDTAPNHVECPAIDGIFISAEELNDEIDDYHVLDTAIAAAMQAVENYTIARYVTIIGWMRQLGHIEGARLMQKSLAQHKRAADAMYLLAERRLNAQAGRVTLVPMMPLAS